MKFWVKSAWFLVIFLLIFLSLTFYVEVGGYKKHLSAVKRYSYQAGVELSLVLAVIKTESGFNEKAVSNKGAKGLMQLMDDTAKFIAKKIGYAGDIDLFDGSTNIYLGVYYLKYLLEKFSSLERALWAYNAGEGNVYKWIREGLSVPPYKETKNYTAKVIRRKIFYNAIV